MARQWSKCTGSVFLLSAEKRVGGAPWRAPGCARSRRLGEATAGAPGSAPRRSAASSHRISVGRLGKAEERAKCVAFLASDDAGFITGATISANGGQFAYREATGRSIGVQGFPRTPLLRKEFAQIGPSEIFSTNSCAEMLRSLQASINRNATPAIHTWACSRAYAWQNRALPPAIS